MINCNILEDNLKYSTTHIILGSPQLPMISAKLTRQPITCKLFSTNQVANNKSLLPSNVRQPLFDPDDDYWVVSDMPIIKNNSPIQDYTHQISMLDI